MRVTDFSKIIFDQTKHSYTYRGQKLTPVNRIINRLKPPFDREGKAAKKATETGRSFAEVLAEWDASRDASMARGTRVHEWIAKKLTGQLPVGPDPFLVLNEKLPEMDAFDRFWAIRPGAGSPPAFVEWVVGDAELGIAGTVDAMLPVDETLYPFDWKTGKAFSTENRFQKLLAPFNYLDDCDLASYSLQLSLYRLIVERNTDLRVGDGYIVHLTTEGEYIIHKALDLREGLQEWLLTR